LLPVRESGGLVETAVASRSVAAWRANSRSSGRAVGLRHSARSECDFQGASAQAAAAPQSKAAIFGVMSK